MRHLTGKTRLGLLLAITLLGAFVRLYQLSALPPGDGYDVAQYGVDALQILDGARPIFLPSNFGREVLFSYLVALVYLFTGPGTFGIHLASALVGIATIPAVFFAADVLLREEQALLAEWGPLLAALVAAVSYWHLNYSRVGLRVIWVPLFAALIVACLGHALRTGRRWAFVAAGGLLGLSLYTYQSARLLPLLVLVGFGVAAIARRRCTRQDVANLFLTFGVALLVFAPLGTYAVRHPEVFNDRVRQALVAQGEQTLAAQVENVWQQSLLALRMFGIEGDYEPLFTIPGRPSLNAFLSLGLVVGILLSLGRWKRPYALFLLAWLVLMTTPAMLADMAATGKRALGAFPAVAILVAVGLLAPPAWLARVRAQRTARLLQLGFAALLGLGFVATTAVTVRDYFIVWGRDPGLPAHFQRDFSEVGRFIGTLPPETAVFVSPFDAAHPAIQLHGGLHPDVRRYDGNHCQIYPAADTKDAAYVIVPGPEEHSVERLRAHFADGVLTRGPLRPDTGEPFYEVFRVSGRMETAVAPQHASQATWDHAIQLLGYNLSSIAAVPGDSITITLYYRALADVDTDYTAFIHLLGPAHLESGNPLWAQVDSEPCQGALPTGTWRAGEIITDSITLSVGPDTPPGEYQLVTGFYTWPDLARLPVETAHGPQANGTAVLQWLTVGAAQP